MKPELLGLWSYFLLWGLAAFTGLVLGIRGLAREGMSPLRATLFVVGLVVLLVLAAKGASTLEYALWPKARPGRPPIFGSLARGFQSPSGTALMVMAIFPLAKALRGPPLRVADAILPILGLATVFFRMGCFLNGCCSGTICELPWALTFPQGSPTHIWQVLEGQVGVGSASLPVHPVQLYYMVLGLAVFALGHLWLRRRAFEGQVGLRCGLLYFSGTFGLELLKVPRVNLNLIVCGFVSMVLAAILLLSVLNSRPARNF